MGKVDSSDIEGIECVFLSHDHRDPHFHAIRTGEWNYRVFFQKPRDEMLEPKAGGRRLNKNHRRALLDKAEAHRAALLKEWEKKVKPDDNQHS